MELFKKISMHTWSSGDMRMPSGLKLVHMVPRNSIQLLKVGHYLITIQKSFKLIIKTSSIFKLFSLNRFIFPWENCVKLTKCVII